MALQDSSDLSLLLVGNKTLLVDELRKSGAEETERLSIVHADEVVSMEDHATSVVRKKKNSSIQIGLRLVKDRDADAFVSAGNSGAIMAGALVVLGRLADVERPAIVHQRYQRPRVTLLFSMPGRTWTAGRCICNSLQRWVMSMLRLSRTYQSRASGFFPMDQKTQRERVDAREPRAYQKLSRDSTTLGMSKGTTCSMVRSTLRSVMDLSGTSF